MTHRTRFLIVATLAPPEPGEKPTIPFDAPVLVRHDLAEPRVVAHRPREWVIYRTSEWDASDIHNCPLCNPPRDPIIDQRRSS